MSDVTKDYLSEFYCILEQMIKGMQEAELSDSISYNFIVQMIPHHRAAIRMSENILQYTTCIAVQNIAQQIIEEQTKSIADMEQIKEECLDCKNCRSDIVLYERNMERIMNTIFCGMENACTTNNINANFMREMIPHHRGAVEMSENALMFDLCCPLVPILDEIIVSQKKGIAQMQQLLRRMG